MKETQPKGKERSIFWPLNRIAKAIGDILLSPFKPPEKAE